MLFTITACLMYEWYIYQQQQHIISEAKKALKHAIEMHLNHVTSPDEESR